MNIFIAFANQDRDVRDKLLRQMNLVKDRQGWNIWSSKEIKAGERWDDEIKQRLMDSEVIVLLLSTDFFNSKYIVETELPKVVEKHRLGNCQIIPVIARVCHWKETVFGEYAELGDIQALPVGEKPIVSRGHWDNDDQPYFEVVEGMKEAIRSWQMKKVDKITGLIATDIQKKDPARTSQVFVAVFALTFTILFVWLILGYDGKPLNVVDPAQPTARQSGLDMVAVEGGTFQMGSPKSETGRENDECQHQVAVNKFSIGKYEVTQAEWQAIMGYNPSKIKNCEQCPVDSVSWEDAQEFLQKLNAKYPGKNYRLPTEVEWEYAAKGGREGQRYQYAGSENFNIVAWCLENSDDQTHVVGQKAPNELGLYDMTGNVWELCQDFYNTYPNCKAIGVEGAYPIIRGGSWGDAALLCRNANRSSCEKSNHNPCVGFRLAHD